MFEDIIFKDECPLERFKLTMFYTENKKGKIILPEADTMLSHTFGWPIPLETKTTVIR